MTTIVSANNELVQQQKADQETVKTKKMKMIKLKEIEANQLELEKQVGALQSKQADLNVLQADLALQQSSKEDEKADLENKRKAIRLNRHELLPQRSGKSSSRT